MRTKGVILTIVSTIASIVATAVTRLVARHGRTGVAVSVTAGAVTAVVYRVLIGPWHRRWGATDAEVAMTLPGDELSPGAAATTRAVTIAAGRHDVWPWLVQLGWGRAGWYSYDWIDNDGRASLEHIAPDLQHLDVGDRILMTPDLGFEVRSIDVERTLVSQAADGTTWCLHLDDSPDGSRLVSRFRAPAAASVGARLWMLLADPGAFIMERRMLLGIARRAERGVPDATGPRGRRSPPDGHLPSSGPMTLGRSMEQRQGGTSSTATFER